MSEEQLKLISICVLIKQVPDTNKVKIDKKTGTLIRKGVKSIFNPDDKNALEEALRLKDDYQNVKITVVSMGPSQAKQAIKEALAMGADRGILLSDRKFAGSDTLATSTILATAIQKLQDEAEFDLIFCGRQAIDGDTAQVGPQIAQHLDLPVITYVQQLKFLGDIVLANRAIENGYMQIEAKTPVVLTTISELNSPRYPNMRRIFEVFGEDPLIPVEIWTIDDLPEIDLTQIGLKGSPTKVKKTFTPNRKFTGEILEGEPSKVAQQIIESLKLKQII